MYEEKELTHFCCELCKSEITQASYWSVVTINNEGKISLENNGLYCETCLPIIKTAPVLNVIKTFDQYMNIKYR